MTTDNIDAELHAKFLRSDAHDWEKIATQELKGKNPFEFLSWSGKDDILFLPYYDAANVVAPHNNASTHSAAEENFPLHHWLNLPLVVAQNEETANKLALDHLQYGADGIVFDVRNALPDLNKLTSNIEWPHCYTGFILQEDATFLNLLTRVLQTLPDVSSIRGGLFWESIPKKDGFDFYINGSKKFKSLGIVLKDGAPSLEIANALMQGVKTVDYFSANHALTDVFSSIAFSITADAHLLQTIAKLRALRRLWFQIAQAYGLPQYSVNDVFVHVRVPHVQDRNYAPHENMLSGTFASVAAVLGSCDAISAEYHASSPMFARWSRNVSSILKEESFLFRAADPLAGAWSIESITNAIAQKAWELFQQNWRDYATT